MSALACGFFACSLTQPAPSVAACWLLQACYFAAAETPLRNAFCMPGWCFFLVIFFFLVSWGVLSQCFCSHALRWVRRGCPSWLSRSGSGGSGCSAQPGDEAYLLKLPHHPTVAMADDQQQPGQKPASGLGSLPALVPGLQGPEANALQFKIKNSIW